eukprot:COSAG02_NODE_411_length_22864_cov_6.757523_8_plen_130_part_00
MRAGTAAFSDGEVLLDCEHLPFGGALRLTAVTDEHAPASHAVWSVGRPKMRNTMFIFELADGLRAYTYTTRVHTTLTSRRETGHSDASRRETGHSGMTKYQIEDGARHSLRVSGAGSVWRTLCSFHFDF